jgi:hypothetical protein
MTLVSLPFPIESIPLFQPVGEPLEILRVINCGPGRDWHIELGYQSDDTQSIVIRAPKSCQRNQLIECLTPYLDEVNSVSIYDGIQVLTCCIAALTTEQRREAHLEFFGGTAVDAEDLSVHLLMRPGKPIPPILLDKQALQSYLNRSTWLGSKKFADKSHAIAISVGPTRLVFKPRTTIEGPGPRISIRKQSRDFAVNSATFSFDGGASEKRTIVRLSGSGELSLDEYQAVFQTFDDTEIAHGVFELDDPKPGKTIGGRKPISEISEGIVKEFGEFIVSIPSDTRYINYVSELAEVKQADAARRLDRRKTALIHTNYVYYMGRLVFKAPTNENELISLHQKLEGMGGVPLASYHSLEFTPQLGIDGIATFRLRQGDSNHNFASVEFEFRFESFFKHGHPMGQTDLIICWQITGPKEQTLTPDPHMDWLFYLEDASKKIPVVCVSKYPKIRIGRLESI